MWGSTKGKSESGTDKEGKGTGHVIFVVRQSKEVGPPTGPGLSREPIMTYLKTDIRPVPRLAKCKDCIKLEVCRPFHLYNGTRVKCLLVYFWNKGILLGFYLYT